MPSLRRTRKGFYFLDLRIDGKRQRISLKTKDRKLASAKAKYLLRELEGPHVARRVTLQEFIPEYLLYAEPRKAKGTLIKERFALQNLAVISNVKYLDDISFRIADDFISVIARKISPHTVNSYLASLRSVFNTALSWEYIAENPFRKVKKIRAELPEVRALSLDEINLILAMTRTMRPAYEPLFQFYLLTGIRRTEAINLEWQDVDFERNVILIKRTKGKRPRIMFLSPLAQHILKTRSEFSKPFDFQPPRVTETFKLIARKAGIMDVKLHNLRASFITYSQDIGMPINFIEKLIGHVNRSVTRDYYTGILPDVMKNYLTKLQEKIFQN